MTTGNMKLISYLFNTKTTKYKKKITMTTIKQIKLKKNFNCSKKIQSYITDTLF